MTRVSARIFAFRQKFSIVSSAYVFRAIIIYLLSITDTTYIYVHEPQSPQSQNKAHVWERGRRSISKTFKLPYLGLFVSLTFTVLVLINFFSSIKFFWDLSANLQTDRISINEEKKKYSCVWIFFFFSSLCTIFFLCIKQWSREMIRRTPHQTLIYESHKKTNIGNFIE